MLIAKIYQPTKNAMQSGDKVKSWILEYEGIKKDEFIDPVMGWTGSSDPNNQIKLYFVSSEEAVIYSKKNNIPYEVLSNDKKHFTVKHYSENFTTD